MKINSSIFVIFSLIIQLSGIWSISDNFIQFDKTAINNSCEINSPKLSLQMDSIFNLYGHEIRVPSIFYFDSMPEGFHPFFDSQEITISNFTVYTPEDWSAARIMYSAKYLIYSSNKVTNAWNGENRYIEGNYLADYEGSFRYTFFASINNRGRKFEGWGYLSRD